MKKFTLFLFLTSLLNSCSSESDCCAIVDTLTWIKYVDEAGSNFLAKEGITEADIEVYHKINGAWEEYYEGNLDSPKGIALTEREGEIYLRLYPNTNTSEASYSETKLVFKNFEGADLIKTKIDRSGNTTRVTEVYYNGELKWQSQEDERIFEVIK
ncbi:hypothetical protein [Salegentibacter chungangensis]|uniref:Lipocalin-like domain-containing protein n=1 Tax=Salegentibacter chungangensis TaxID=1335724 RepID=A0ABW3NP70_9FLAO